MALAAVVVLFAATKSIMVAAFATAAATRGNDNLMRGLRRKRSMTREAIKLLIPAMAKGFQSMTFIKSPPILHIEAVIAMAAAPVNLLFMFINYRLC